MLRKVGGEGLMCVCTYFWVQPCPSNCSPRLLGIKAWLREGEGGAGLGTKDLDPTQT